MKGQRPTPRYRHSAITCYNTMIVFGGVDTNSVRFNELYSYEFDKRKWTLLETNGDIPQPRTFHRAVNFNNIMYTLGGFDGTRLNDMHHIALPGNLYEEDSESMRRISRPHASITVNSFSNKVDKSQVIGKNLENY